MVGFVLYQSESSINIFFITAVGLGIIALLVDRWINVPIRKVAEGAKKIKDGNFETRIEISSKDEIGELAETMNELATTLESDISNMKKMEQVRTEFLSNVTHELKTPIASIAGYLETLKDGALTDNDVNRTFIKRSLKNAKRLEALVTDLVDISRIETGEMEIQLEKVDLKPLLEEVINDAQQRNEKHELDISLEMNNQKEIIVNGNLDRLRQVFDNLISNAIRYTVNGSVVMSTEKNNGVIEFKVQDTGIGIDAESAERIFERFFRTDRARQIVRGGTGLGLAISKHIIEAHNSNISVESSEKNGSTFSFNLKSYTN
ncbi:MAG: two-component sensor histidine kinase [Candidatus Marinimicrobia bacterium]|nr:two-component sensor histidine kinase [Candidatus Neomarinimicrobiota bacterium]|tara:strand:- start:3604 stop:4560 length:957 start_codon:yes stop_codon:yes gene_type:complete